ncbi:MAG: DUF547 domain-containing protein [Candidatus Methylomirabilales bacterium]
MAGLVWLSAVAAPAHAIDYTAYAELFQAHVRPGTINGIRLHVVDYRMLQGDPNYVKALTDFAMAEPGTFKTEAERLVFWVNAYNLLVIKAVIDQYPTQSIRYGGSLFRSIWKKKVGVIAGKEYALDDIEHDILRKELQEPRVHFAIVCASLSCPDLRAEPYAAERIDAQLDDATRTFLQNPTKGLLPGRDGQPTEISRIFKWFREDFAPVGGVVTFIRAKVPSIESPQTADLSDSDLAYIEYDWTLNDASRTR